MNDDSLADTHAPKVLPFKPRVVTPEVTPSNHNTSNPKIVKLLEDYLKAARAGKILFIGIATVSDVGVANSNWEPEMNSAQLNTQAIGAVSFLDHRFNDAILAGMAESDDLQTDPDQA